MNEKELEAKIAALEARNAALEAKVAGLVEIANKGFGVCTSEEASTTGEGTARIAMNNMRQPKEIDEAMTKNVSTEMLRQIVSDGRG
jgi:hypothetical protein